MIIIKIISAILWLCLGIVILKNKTVTRFEYGITWITLIFNLVANIFE